MTQRFLRPVLAAFAALLAPLAFAQAPATKVTLHFDPAQTQIHWTLGDVLHTVHGTFRLKGGLVLFDPSTGTADGELLVDLDSGESGNTARDSRMKKDILGSPTFPEAIFHPEKVSGTLRPGSTQQLAIDGLFTIHGHDHPLHLNITTKMTGADHVAITTQFIVPYVAWGMKDPSTLVLRCAKQVTVDVSAQSSVENLH